MIYKRSEGMPANFHRSCSSIGNPSVRISGHGPGAKREGSYSRRSLPTHRVSQIRYDEQSWRLMYTRNNMGRQVCHDTLALPSLDYC